MAKSSLLIFLILLGLLGSISPIVSIYAHKIVVLLAGSLVLFYALSLISSKHMDYKLIQLTPLSILFILFLSWSALGYLYSADPEKSLFLTIQSLGAMLLYLGLILHIQRESQIETVLKILLCFGGVLALLGILQQFSFPFLKNPVHPRQISTSLFVHKNIFSGYLVSLIPLSCLVYLSSFSKIWKYIAGILFILFLTALGFSGSRGGQLVVIISLPAIMGYLIFNKDLKRTMLLAQGIVASIILYLVIDSIAKKLALQISGSSFVDGRASLVNLVQGGFSLQIVGGQWLNRILFWQGAWEIFKDHWLIGSGPLSFSLLFPKYLLNFTPIIKNQFLTSGAPPHAHNLFIQTASDSGLIGIGLMLAFLTIFYIRAYKLFRVSSFEIRSTVFFFAIAVTCFLVHNMAEYNWPYPMFIYHFTFFVFAIDFTYRKQFDFKKINRPKTIAFILPTLGIIVIFFTLVSCAQYYKFHSILDERFPSGTNLQKLTSLIERAKQSCPRCDKPYIKMAMKLLATYRVNSEKKLLLLAKDELLEGRKLNPYNPHYMGYLGQVFAIEGDYGRGLRLLKEALRFNQTHHIAKLGLSAVELQRLDR